MTAPQTQQPRVFAIALDTWDGEGGIQRYNRRLQQVLTELHETNEIGKSEFLSVWDSPAKRNTDGVLVRGIKATDSASVTRIKRLLSFARAVPVFARDFARLRPHQFVITHKVLLPFAILGKAVFPRTSITLVIYGVEVWAKLNGVERLGLKLVKQTASISDFTTRRATEINSDFQTIPTHKIPCAVDAPTGPRPDSKTRNPLSIITTARLSARARDKNIDQLIRAISVVKDIEPNVRLTIIGDGGDRPRLERIANQEYIEANVAFTGRISDEDKNNAFADAAMFVLPSTREGFGIVYLEAWEHGLPVIAGNDGAAPEIVENDVVGLSVSPTPEAIAEAIAHLLKNPELREQFAAGGYDRLLTTYSHENFRAGWGTLLRGLPG